MLAAVSYASTNSYPGAAFAGRLSGDPGGTLSAPTTVAVGAGPYNPNDCSPLYRWGDLSSVVVDPADNMTMWSFQEYTNATDSWGVLVTEYPAPQPATLSSSSPSFALAGTTLSVTVTGLSMNGSGF